MKEGIQPSQESKTQPTLNENVACDVCGRFGAYSIGERLLCQECYIDCGSCCREFGSDDLWAISAARDNASPPKRERTTAENAGDKTS